MELSASYPGALSAVDPTVSFSFLLGEQPTCDLITSQISQYSERSLLLIFPGTHSQNALLQTIVPKIPPRISLFCGGNWEEAMLGL